MAISEIIKCEKENKRLIWKYPKEDFNSITELVVHEGQEAIFFANGQAADTFGPGRYKLNSENVPLLTKLINNITGVSVFHCEVYFINKTVQADLKWGTISKARFVEPTLGVPIEIGASGEMNLVIENGRKLLIKLVGTMNGINWEEDEKDFAHSLESMFRPIISTSVRSNLPIAIKEKNIDIIDIDQHLVDLSNILKDKIANDFEEYGLSICQFNISNLVLPEEDQNFVKLKNLHYASLEIKEASVDVQKEVARREAILEKEATKVEVAKKQAEIDVINAQAQAQAAELAGMAHARVMNAQGYSHKDEILADVQKEYAKGIGNMDLSSSGGNSVVGDMVGLGVGLSAMGTIAPKIGEMMNNFNNQTSQSTITCPKCGKVLPTDSKFCPECGEKLNSRDDEIICPVCGNKTNKGKFCSQCGTALEIECPKCKAKLTAGTKFCPECGEKL